MKRIVLALGSGLLVLALAAPAAAAFLEFVGSLDLELGTLPPVTVTGSGIAQVNGSGSAGHLNTLRLMGGITGSATVPITDPLVTQGGIVEIRAMGTLGTGTLEPISGALQNTSLGLSMGTLPVRGEARICLFFAGCNSGALTLPFTNNGTVGFGIGGLVTPGGGSSAAVRISVLAAPWTIKNVVLSNRTDNGGLTFPTAQGFAHGPASMTSSTAMPSGVVQLVTPLQVTTAGIPGNNDRISLIGRLRLHFVPEPDVGILLLAGAAGLVLAGRRRR